MTDVKQPSTSDDLRCPKCRSYDCECSSTKESHTHRCNACGYETVIALAALAYVVAERDLMGVVDDRWEVVRQRDYRGGSSDV